MLSFRPFIFRLPKCDPRRWIVCNVAHVESANLKKPGCPSVVHTRCLHAFLAFPGARFLYTWSPFSLQTNLNKCVRKLQSRTVFFFFFLMMMTCASHISPVTCPDVLAGSFVCCCPSLNGRFLFIRKLLELHSQAFWSAASGFMQKATFSLFNPNRRPVVVLNTPDNTHTHTHTIRTCFRYTHNRTHAQVERFVFCTLFPFLICFRLYSWAIPAVGRLVPFRRSGLVTCSPVCRTLVDSILLFIDDELPFVVITLALFKSDSCTRISRMTQ